jgi:hypothetical protein
LHPSLALDGGLKPVWLSWSQFFSGIYSIWYVRWYNKNIISPNKYLVFSSPIDINFLNA